MTLTLHPQAILPRRRFFPGWVALHVSLFALILAPSHMLAARDSLRPVYADVPPVIDGKLDDPVWERSPYVSRFKTFIPDFGRDGSFPTSAYMAYDKDHLYFAFRCYDPEPGNIRSSLNARDDIENDDWVCVNLDTFNDQQTVSAFYVNPSGVQADSRYVVGNEDFNQDFAWYSAGHMDNDGYTVEFSIPLKSLRYSDGDTVFMSVIFQRFVSRTHESSTFPELDPAQGYDFLPQMIPIAYQGVRPASLLEIIPAFTFNQHQHLEAGSLTSPERKGEVSLTGKYGLTSSLVLDGTLNPDFSQVEADAGQVDVNLRYALFFPEKRPFFQEGNEIYRVAATSTSGIDPVHSIVHTRMIANPSLGAKLSGKIGSGHTVAVLYALDKPFGDPGSPPAGDAHFTILRDKYVIAGDDYIGGIYAGRETANSYNRVLGTDAIFRTSPSSVLQGNALASFSKLAPGARASMGHSLALMYRSGTRELDYTLALGDISREFLVESGYVSRTGVRSLSALVRPKFYPSLSVMPHISIELFASHTLDKFSNMSETYDHVKVAPLVFGSLEPELGLVYATEIYAGQRFKTDGYFLCLKGLLSNQFHVLIDYINVNAVYYGANPFQGRDLQTAFTLSYQPVTALELVTSVSYSKFFRSSDDALVYDYLIARARSTVKFSRFLFFRGTVEYNRYRNSLMTDLLASFTYLPGTAVYLGYGSLFERLQWDPPTACYVPGNRLLETERGLFAKLSYLWRF